MNHVAKLFMNGRSQAIRLPAAFRFNGDEVFIRQDPVSGDVILSSKPSDWDGFVETLQGLEVPESFLSRTERDQGEQDRDSLAGWVE